jgi:eukaryotic-like serine/threonine-protein kinase
VEDPSGLVELSATIAPQVGYDLVKTGEIVEGRYKILRPLADGGMGTVFLAEHWLIKRKVALKILHKDLVDDPTMIRRFMNEALAAGTLGHPNIVESTDMGFTQQDVPYIVFEYLEGSLLSEEILRLHEMPVSRVLSIAHQIARHSRRRTMQASFIAISRPTTSS